MANETDTSLNESTTETNANTPDVNQVVNAAVTSHTKRLEKSFQALLVEQMKPLLAEIAALKAPKAETPAANADDKAKADPMLAAMAQQLADVKSQMAQTEAARAAAVAKAASDRAYSDLKSELGGKVRPEFLNMLANNLFHVEKTVEIDEDGVAVYKTQAKNAFGQYEEMAFSLKDGVAHFLKSEEAKAFLPAPSASGAPTTRRTTVQSGQRFEPGADVSKMTMAQKLAYNDQLEADMAARLRRAQGQ